MTQDELMRGEPGDETLKVAREGSTISSAEGSLLLSQQFVVQKNRRGNKSSIMTEQLVLPVDSRQAVMRDAHEIPLSGHLGKQKTTKRNFAAILLANNLPRHS